MSKKEKELQEETKTRKEKKSKEKKKSGGISGWFKSLKTEMKKLTWPTKETVASNTGVVVAFVAVAALFVGLVDAGFLALLKLALGIGA